MIKPHSNQFPNNNYLSKRTRSFGMTMIVMGISFGLYYLGFFGGIDGPLSSDNLALRLKEMGVTQRHVMIFFLTLLLFTSVWNWVYNLISYINGSRLTCKKEVDGKPCGEPVIRLRCVGKKTGYKYTVYVCKHAHRLNEAHFHPIRKGTVSHCLWLTSIVFCGIVFFST